MVCGDTDTFVLLLHFYHEGKVTSVFQMEVPSHSQASIDIGETSIKHSGIIPYLVSAHDVTGCDTVGAYYGTGKAKVIKVLQSDHKLSYISNQESDTGEVIREATAFIVACYGVVGSWQMILSTRIER